MRDERAQRALAGLASRWLEGWEKRIMIFTRVLTGLPIVCSSALIFAACAAPAVHGADEPEVGVTTQELSLRGCRTPDSCPQPSAPCRECADGSFVCPEVDCIDNRCVYSFPQCPPTDACALVNCGVGTHCVEGACVSDERVTCGGIAAFPCPGAGRCIDDPTDDCDPRAGGADCGGICDCELVQLCPAGTQWDPSPSVCACLGNGGCGGNACAAN